MTSSSSLYGTVTTQNSSSTNSTSLYGGADTPIPDSSGNVVVRGDLYVLSGNILTTASTGNIFPTNATTINFGNAATTLNIGAGSGTTTINNNLTVGGDITADGADFGNITIAVADDNTITTTTGALKLGSATGLVGLVGADTLYTDQTTFNLLNSPTTVNAFFNATALNIGETTGTTTIRNALTVLDDITAPGADLGNITVGITNNNTINNTVGDLILSTTTGEVGLVGVDTLYTDQTTFNLLNSPTSVTAFDSATTLVLGQTTGTTTIRNDLTVQGDITADGGDFGLITIGVADDQTITTTSGELRISSATDVVKLEGVDTLYTDTTGTFSLLNAPTTVTAFQSATALSFGAVTGTTTIRNDLVVQGGITAGGADFGNIQIAVLDNQTISTTSGELRLTSTSGDVKLEGIDTLYTDTTGTFNLLNAPATVNAFQNASALSLGDTTGATTIRNDLVVGDDLTITGNNLNLAQASTIGYSENNDRTNRPQVQSTTGNSSGFRVLAPNATTSASSNLTAFATNDIDNGEFISVQATGSTSAPFNIRTGKYTAGVLGASNEEINFIDNVTVYASINPAGPTNSTDLTTKAYVDALPANITYTIDSSSTTGGANFNLVGSDATTDTIKFSGGTNVTVTATSANEITISAPDTNTTYTQNASSTTGGANLNLVGSDSTTDSVKFAGGTNVTVVATDANTITINAPDTNTTYDFAPTSTTGGANLNLTGSDSTTDTVKISNGTGVTVAQVSGTEVSVAIGQAVGTGDDVQFNSVRTPTINANGGVNFVNTGVGGGTYATVNQFGPANTNDLTTVGYVNSILPTVVTYTIDASSTTGGANFNLAGSNATTDTIKFSGSGATTVAQTSANEITVSSTDTNTTYDFNATSTTGGANLNLVGSDSTTDTVKVSSGTGVTVAQVSGTEVSVAIGQAVGTGDSPAFAGVTGGNITVGVATDNTIASTDTNGNVTVAPNGTGKLVVTTSIDGDLVDDSYILGQLRATTNTAYTFPPVTLTTVASGSGVAAASSIANGNGYSASSTFTHYYGDTRAGTNTVGSFTFQAANGVSDTSVTRPWEGTVGSAVSAITTNGVLGSFNFAGYGTTNFVSNISGANQGGGFNVTHPLQAQGYATETFADGTLTISGATITNVTRVSVNFANVQITGTKGQISFNATTPAVGNAVAVSGTSSGTGTGITAGTYFVIATNGSTTAQLSATPGGAPITTTAGTTTGLTLTRQFITVTYSAQSNIPFGLNALVTISGFTNVTSGTYMAQGTSTTTQILIGAPSSGAPALSGSQSVSCPTVTAAGAAFRVRGVPVATPLNSGNRFNFIDHSAAAATYRADTFTIAGGAYGGTSAARVTVDSSKVTMALPVVFPNYTVATLTGASPTLVGAVGWQVAVSDSPTYAGRMAYWSTTATAGWRYVDDNTAV